MIFLQMVCISYQTSLRDRQYQFLCLQVDCSDSSMIFRPYFISSCIASAINPQSFAYLTLSMSMHSRESKRHVRYCCNVSNYQTQDGSIYLNLIIIIIMKPMIEEFIKLTQIYSSINAVSNIYLHLPFCRKKCHFCAFPIHAIGSNPQEQMLDLYIKNLKQQILLSKPYINLNNPLRSIYFGGGTPSLHSASHISNILEQFNPSLQTQITVQVNPSQINSIKNLLQIGVNRISLGVQSFNQQVLNDMGRYVQANSLQIVTQKLISARPKNLNVDFILNLCMSDKSWKEMIQFIEHVRPQHLTIYFLEVNEGSKIYTHPEIISKLPHEEQVIHRFIQLCNILQRLGYDHYEVSNFARRKQYRSIHSSAYWQGNKEYLAYGMGGTSLIAGRRITRPRTISKYYKYLDEIKKGPVSLSNLQVSCENNVKSILTSVIMSGIRTAQGISWQKIHDITNQTQTIQRMLNCLLLINETREGIINIENIKDRISLTRVGFLLGDQIGYQLIESIQQAK